MAKKIWICIYIFFFWFGTTDAAESLTLRSIPVAMNRLFKYHIENKELSAVLVKRSFRIYIEQFDPHKVYLLEEEIAPYYNMSDEQATKIIERYHQGDFSDYVQLNSLIQSAIRRSREVRVSLSEELSSNDELHLRDAARTNYAESKEELLKRQKMQMVKFLRYHEKRVPVSSKERKLRVFHLFEKKIRHPENSYLLEQPNGTPYSKNKANHYLALRILKSLAKSLDAHTSFFSENEAHMMRVSLEKQFQGIGIVLSEGIDGVFIADIIDGSPADQSGKIQVNDYITSINGSSLQGLSFQEVLQKLKNNDRIILGIKRLKSNSGSKKAKSWEVSLDKKPIVMESGRLTYKTEKFGDGVIGRMTMHSFYENGNGIDSATDMRRAIQKMSEQGPIYGLILDLRENSGGFLSQAVKVAGLFIKSGVIVISKYSQGKTQYLRKVDTKAAFNGPLIVLTSKLSASASEIVAQALQDYGAALIVGDQRTFGKGSIQYQTITNPGSDMFFKVTVGRYYTVSGKSTQINGVKADIVVPTTFSAYNLGEKFLEYPLPADKISSAYQDNLEDLDIRAKFWFQKNYLPNLQKKIPFWTRLLPQLRENSERRLANNPNFQLFLRRQAIIRERQEGKKPTRVIEVDENYGVEDLQMQESVEIMKDMIYMSQSSKKHSKAA